MLWGCESLASQETAVQTSASRFKKFFREVKAEMKKSIMAEQTRTDFIYYYSICNGPFCCGAYMVI